MPRCGARPSVQFVRRAQGRGLEGAAAQAPRPLTKHFAVQGACRAVLACRMQEQHPGCGLLCLAPPRARPTRAMALNGSCARTLDKHVPPCTITPPRHAMHSQAAAHKPMPSSFEVQTSHTLCCAGKVQGIDPTHKPMPSNFEVQTLAHPLLRRRHAGHRPRDAAREGHVRAH